MEITTENLQKWYNLHKDKIASEYTKKYLSSDYWNELIQLR